MKFLILFILYLTTKQCENIIKQSEEELITQFKQNPNIIDKSEIKK